jgi:hypothetical protein
VSCCATYRVFLTSSRVENEVSMVELGLGRGLMLLLLLLLFLL